LAETAESTPQARHDEVWALIPWHVNGTLAAPEAERVRRHLEVCEACAAEVDRQLGVAARVCMLDDAQMTEARERSWETLRARIESEERARAPARPAQGRLAQLLSRLTSRRGLALAGVACAAALAVAVTLPTAGTDDAYRTLTSPASPTGSEAGLAIRFQTAPDLAPPELERLLAAEGLTLLGGPSEGGVFRAAAPEGADLSAAAQALMAAPQILFAAPETQP
tara:strand:- start:110 stop:781 length:672 start_codon:yes stop_codon:yes gene_type:complete